MPLKVGSEVDAWCTKCRMDLSHLVVALLEGKPKRVECETCHTQHNFRAPKGATEPVPKDADLADGEAAPKAATKKKAATKTPRITKAQAEYAAEWDARCEGKTEDEYTPFSVKHTFDLDELLIHKKFGLGFVFEILDDRKITVFFKDGPKTLVHDRE